MTIRHGDVPANLERARQLVRAAIKQGAAWIVLPEFFTSGYGAGNDPALIDAHRPVDGEPTRLLKELAKECGGAVGGSFLAQGGKDTYNTFVLAPLSTVGFRPVADDSAAEGAAGAAVPNALQTGTFVALPGPGVGGMSIASANNIAGMVSEENWFVGGGSGLAPAVQ